MSRFFSFIFKSNFKIYFLSLAASASGILLNFVLARFLEAEAYGKIQYLVALATTVSNFLVFGINSFVLREAKNEKRNDSLISKCFSLYFAIFTFVVPIVFYILINYLNYTAGSLALSVTVIAVAFLIGLSTITGSYYTGLGRHHISATFETLVPKSVLLILALVCMALEGLQFFQEQYLLFYVGIYSVICLVFFIKLFRGFSLSFSSADALSILFFFGVTVTYSLTTNLTKVFQGTFYDDATALGVISVSLSLVSLISVFTSVVDNIIKPFYAKYKRDNNFPLILETYRLNTRSNSYIAIPFYIFFITQPEKFLGIFGPSYTVYPSILVILAIQSMVSVLTGPNGGLLAMTGKESLELINGSVNLAVYLGFAIIFKSNKIYGLSFALLLSQIAVNILKYIEVWIIYKKTPLDLKTILTLFFCAIVDFPLIFASRFISSFWIWLLLGMLSGALCIFLNFCVSLYRKNDFKQLLSCRL